MTQQASDLFFSLMSLGSALKKGSGTSTRSVKGSSTFFNGLLGQVAHGPVAWLPFPGRQRSFPVISRHLRSNTLALSLLAHGQGDAVG